MTKWGNFPFFLFIGKYSTHFLFKGSVINDLESLGYYFLGRGKYPIVYFQERFRRGRDMV